jgi:hypothetical protein
LWSVSGEEQLAPEDFGAEKPSCSLFQRAFCEEVLGYRERIPLVERWQWAEPIVEIMTLWSVFLEEGIHNYALLGAYLLNCDAKEFLRLHREIIRRCRGTRDPEGKLYLISAEESMRLLTTGQGTARAISSREPTTLQTGVLHPTSRYRMIRVLRALRRGTLAP